VLVVLQGLVLHQTVAMQEVHLHSLLFQQQVVLVE
jgi:hypothetical protein